MDIESLLRESRAETLKGPLGIQTTVGNEQFSKQLRKYTSNIGILQRRQETVLTLRNSLTKEVDSQLESLFQTVREIEPELSVFFTRTDVESDSYGQLLFSTWKPLQVLNTIPFLLLCLSFYKQYIVPFLAVMMPLFMIVMPYVLLKFIYKLPLSPQQYTQILMNMFGLQYIHTYI